MHSQQLSSSPPVGRKEVISSFRLFDLPRELRDKIYEFVLTSGLVQNFDEAYRYEHSTPIWHYPHETQRPPRGELPPNLAAVCWQIRNKTLRLYRSHELRETVLQQFWEPPRDPWRASLIVVLQTPLIKRESYMLISQTWNSLLVLARHNFEFRCFLPEEAET